MEEKEEFEEVCKVRWCYLQVYESIRWLGLRIVLAVRRFVSASLCMGMVNQEWRRNTPLASATVSAEPRSSDVGKGSDNGPIA